MPSFPTPEVQSMFVGSSGEQAIREAWAFYEFMADRRRRHGCRLGATSHVLDFGCGWGRFARMFLRDVPASHIWCVDSWDRALETCEETGVPGRRVKIEQMPPSALPDSTFDTAFAYSVFSHLSPRAHLAWRDELARVTKSGALVFITTQARWFLDTCRDLREHPERQSSGWQEVLSRSFVDYDASVAGFDRGEIQYAASPGRTVLGPDYGQAVVPRAFFEREWSRDFELLEFIEDRSSFEQAVAVLRRR